MRGYVISEVERRSVSLNYTLMLLANEPILMRSLSIEPSHFANQDYFSGHPATTRHGSSWPFWVSTLQEYRVCKYGSKNGTGCRASQGFVRRVKVKKKSCE